MFFYDTLIPNPKQREQSNAIDSRYRKYGKRSQILSLRYGPWCVGYLHPCPTRIPRLLLWPLSFFFFLCLFACPFVRSRLVVEGDEWWRREGYHMVLFRPDRRLKRICSLHLSKPLGYCFGSFVPLSQARPRRLVSTSHSVIFFFCGWVCCGNAMHPSYNSITPSRGRLWLLLFWSFDLCFVLIRIFVPGPLFAPRPFC